MYKGYFIDLDGTMYKGKERIPSAERFIARLQEKNIPFLFVTNNATRTPEEVAEHLKAYNVHVSKEAVYTSGMAAIDYLKREITGNKVLLIGEHALRTQLLEAGYHLTDEQPDVVLQSLNREVTYKELEAATLAIRAGASFITTNIDSNLPSEKGFVPGSGSITAFLKEATQVEPVVIGKPSSIVMQGALERIGLAKEDVAMIGDNYQTDIQAGIQFHMPTIMVLTGFSTAEDIEGLEQPTHLIQSLDEWHE